MWICKTKKIKKLKKKYYTVILFTAGLLRSSSFLSTSDKLFLASPFTSTPLVLKASKVVATKMNINLFTIFSLSQTKQTEQIKMARDHER
jgi:hypothetical protein